MNKSILIPVKSRFLSCLLLSIASFSVSAEEPAEDATNIRTLQIFDEVVFYDGYNPEIFDTDLDDGIIRHANHLRARKLTEEELDWFGEGELTMNVIIGALCDNYDRIGNINLALVPKGSSSYDPYTTHFIQRIELGRFITPFMNKNNKPKEVPYSFTSNSLGMIFRDAILRIKYDYYLEFELFGVPYAANKEVRGCEGRSDVFTGTLTFESADEGGKGEISNHRLYPVAIKLPEHMGHNLNNFSSEATDTLGTCTKTYRFNIDGYLTDARMTFIISNHGANEDGEEYNRRKHLIYFDDELMMVYTPGGESCEPFRRYNTQPNGIYGYRPQPKEYWEEWNNWCPGSAIPVREIELGNLSGREHKIMIRVPDAVFPENQGDFPISIYVQGVSDGKLPSGIDIIPEQPSLNIRRDGEMLFVTSESPVAYVDIVNSAGNYVVRGANPYATDISSLPEGVFFVLGTLYDGRTGFCKFIR